MGESGWLCGFVIKGLDFIFVWITGKVLKVLAELTDRTGFDSALTTVNQALCYSASDADSLQNLYRRIYTNVPELPPMPLGSDVPSVGQMPADLIMYDAFLRKEGSLDA